MRREECSMIKTLKRGENQRKPMEDNNTEIQLKKSP